MSTGQVTGSPRKGGGFVPVSCTSRGTWGSTTSCGEAASNAESSPAEARPCSSGGGEWHARRRKDQPTPASLPCTLLVRGPLQRKGVDDVTGQIVGGELEQIVVDLHDHEVVRHLRDGGERL